MSYTPEMRESIERVAATRSRRLSETWPMMTPAEKQDVLQKFHPDYKPEGMREIRVGHQKEIRMPLELADVMEGYSHLTAETLDLSQVDIETDVLIIGGGGAGSAAGIQAADRPEDSPAIHYLDVMGGGHYANYPDLAEVLVKDAPLVIKWLEDLGCMFDKLSDGTMVEAHGGGTSRMRMHSARDYSGAEIMRTLRDEVRSYPEEITVLEFAPAVELLMDDKGQVAGAVLVNMETNARCVVKAKTTILATGGSGRLHYQDFATTNHYGATGDGVILAYRVGAKLDFLDTMQYHPTGAAFPEQIVGLLVTEKVRGLGAQVCNIDGQQFVYPRETRDVEASALIRECVERGTGVKTPSGMTGVWLDSPMIDLIHGPGTIQKALPAMVRQFGRFGIDIIKDPMLVYPTLHYQNGGVALGPDGETTIPNLYGAGEISGGVHGRNRLMGNSLLEICVFGRRAGMAAAERAKEVTLGKLTLAHVDAWNKEVAELGIKESYKSPILLPDYTRQVR